MNNCDYKKDVLRYYIKENKFKYFVLKIEDLINALSVEEIYKFWDILDTFNNYRYDILGKEKLNRYMVLNMDEFTKFSSFDEFYNWIKKKYEEDKTI